jgi:hypothetical protein
MKFDYVEIGSGIFAPIVTLEIFNGEWIGFQAYVDSGASYSLFHADAAKILGIDYKTGRKVYITVGDGRRIPTYIFKLPVKFSNLKFKAIIGFSKKLGVGFNLLGRADFFDRFKICFSDRNKVLQTTME